MSTPSKTYKIIYYQHNSNFPLVETRTGPLENVVNRCRWLCKEDGYKRAEVLEYNPLFSIESTLVETIPLKTDS